MCDGKMRCAPAAFLCFRRTSGGVKEAEGAIVCLSGAKVKFEDCLPDGVLSIFEITLHKVQEVSMLASVKVVCKGSGNSFIAIACHRVVWVVNKEAEIFFLFTGLFDLKQQRTTVLCVCVCAGGWVGGFQNIKPEILGKSPTDRRAREKKPL